MEKDKVKRSRHVIKRFMLSSIYWPYCFYKLLMCGAFIKLSIIIIIVKEINVLIEF